MLTKPSVAVAIALFAALPGPLPAQEGASLAEVEALAAAGSIMEARETLETWWTTRFDNASRADRQWAIWLRGKLTVDPDMADLDYRRLVMEFPGGPYSDDALFRLGQSAELKGELVEARSAFQSLVRDYPSSPRVPEAQGWLASHAAALQSLPDATEPREPPRRLPAEATPPAGEFAVQLGAFRSLESARTLAERLREAGYEARLVRTPGNDLARVRVGRFATRDPADALARELASQGFEVTLVTDARSEERVGSDPPL